MADTPYALATYERPASRTIRIAMITVSAWFACLERGSLNAVTPFETASTPVMAAHPLANAFSRSQIVRYFIVARMGGGGADTGTGCPPAATACRMPTITVA